MKKLILLAMVLGLLMSGCGAGLVVNVKSTVDNYKKDFPEVNILIANKCNLYHGETSYRAMRKRIVWNSQSVKWTAGTLILTDSFLSLLSQREDQTITPAFKVAYSDIDDVIVERYARVMGLIISTSDKTYVLEMAKGVVVDRQSTVAIYNLILSKTKNLKGRQPISLTKEAEEKKIKEEEQSKPAPSGGSTGWGGK